MNLIDDLIKNNEKQQALIDTLMEDTKDNNHLNIYHADLWNVHDAIMNAGIFMEIFRKHSQVIKE